MSDLGRTEGGGMPYLLQVLSDLTGPAALPSTQGWQESLEPTLVLMSTPKVLNSLATA